MCGIVEDIGARGIVHLPASLAVRLGTVNYSSDIMLALILPCLFRLECRSIAVRHRVFHTKSGR